MISCFLAISPSIAYDSPFRNFTLAAGSICIIKITPGLPLFLIGTTAADSWVTATTHTLITKRLFYLTLAASVRGGTASSVTAGFVWVAAAGLAGTVNAFFAVGGIAGSWAAGTFCIGDVALNYNRIRRSITF
jgi:hypothetical protein